MAKTSGGIRNSPINHDAVSKARAILKGFDWFWDMVDSGFIYERNRAHTQMRQFVDYASKAGSKRMTKQLRNEWTKAYNEALEKRTKRFR